MRQMLVQLSSGQGPAECELAVGKLFRSLYKEYGGLELISEHRGRREGCYSSILFKTEKDLKELEGSIQWICTSPFRPHHKRRNWFVDVSIIPERELICNEQEYRFERFHCGGKGGQNVNKVETGVRLIHIPSGISVTATEERSQFMNKKRAMEKMQMILHEQELLAQKKQVNQAWREHTKIVRGNPVRVYEGISFIRKNKI